MKQGYLNNHTDSDRQRAMPADERKGREKSIWKWREPRIKPPAPRGRIHTPAWPPAASISPVLSGSWEGMGKWLKGLGNRGKDSSGDMRPIKCGAGWVGTSVTAFTSNQCSRLAGWLCCITTYVTANARHKGTATFLLKLCSSQSASSCHSCV